VGPLATEPGIGALMPAALAQLAGIVLGAGSRELVRLVAGADPRSARLWTLELAVLVVLAALLGHLFALAADVTAVGPPFGAALTAYAALSGGRAYVAARESRLTSPWGWAVLHGAACVAVGVAGFAAALLLTGIGPR